MRRSVLLFLFIPLFAKASDVFGVEDRILKPNKIPLPVIFYLNENLSDDLKLCDIEKIDEAFEAKLVKISIRSKALVVKPKSWCLCGAYYCPIWLFQVEGNSATSIWSTTGAGALEVLDKKTNAYRKIKESGGVAMHGYESIWVWDGKKYTETYKQNWKWNNEKSCREVEIFGVKHGELEKAPNSCIPD